MFEYMRLLFCTAIFGSLCIFAAGQKVDVATATYSKNGRMIGVTNLSGLSDCQTRSARGTASKVKVDGDIARVTLKEKKISSDVEIPLNRLSPEDRNAIFKKFVSKKAKLRVAGYSCTSEATIVAFSVDRIY